MLSWRMTMTTLHCRMSVVEVLLSLPARRYDSAGNRRSYGPVSVCLCRPMSSGVLLKMELGIRKGAWRRSWRYPVYLWSLRRVYAVKKTRRLVYGRCIPAYTPPIHHCLRRSVCLLQIRFLFKKGAGGWFDLVLAGRLLSASITLSYKEIHVSTKTSVLPSGTFS